MSSIVSVSISSIVNTSAKSVSMSTTESDNLTSNFVTMCRLSRQGDRERGKGEFVRVKEMKRRREYARGKEKETKRTLEIGDDTLRFVGYYPSSKQHAQYPLPNVALPEIVYYSSSKQHAQCPRVR